MPAMTYIPRGKVNTGGSGDWKSMGVTTTANWRPFRP
jgi:hypothetical protein